MIEATPGKWDYFDQIIFKANESAFSFSKVNLAFLRTLDKFKPVVLDIKLLCASFLIHCTHFRQAMNYCEFGNFCVSELYYSNIFSK